MKHDPKEWNENDWRVSLSRRNALRGLAGFLAASQGLVAQQDVFRDHSRIPGMSELLTVIDFEAVAYAKVSREVSDYTGQGVDGEWTLRRNRQAFDWVDIVPQSLVDVSSVNTSSELLGTPLPFPIMVAPTAGHGQLYPQGELAMYEGVTAASQSPMIVSNNATFPMSKIATAAKGSLWFQLYPREQIDASRRLIEGAQEAGARALVVTVDQQASYYERALHNRQLSGGVSRRAAATPARPAAGNPYRIQVNRLWYDWAFMDSIRAFTKIPIVVKGIVTPQDAKLCVDHGVNAILVSNHGGRSLDYGPSTLEVLPEIVDIVAGRVPVIVDSGFRRGSDIFKALAIGAKAVCVGRASRWGLAAFGAPGAQRVFEILQQELVTTMAQAGYPNLDSITRKAIRMEFP